jgi:hypothetical protein
MNILINILSNIVISNFLYKYYLEPPDLYILHEYHEIHNNTFFNKTKHI